MGASLRKALEEVFTLIVHVFVPVWLYHMDPSTLTPATVCFALYQAADYLGGESPRDVAADAVEWMFGITLAVAIKYFLGT